MERVLEFRGEAIDIRSDEKHEACSWRLSPFGGLQEVRFRVHTDSPFREENWAKMPSLLGFLDEHLAEYLDTALSALRAFAEVSGMFRVDRLAELDLRFEDTVMIPDNWPVIIEPINERLNNWLFDLVFSERRFDGLGHYIVSFEGRVISCIRRRIY